MKCRRSLFGEGLLGAVSALLPAIRVQYQSGRPAGCQLARPPPGSLLRGAAGVHVGSSARRADIFFCEFQNLCELADLTEICIFDGYTHGGLTSSCWRKRVQVFDILSHVRRW